LPRPRVDGHCGLALVTIFPADQRVGPGGAPMPSPDNDERPDTAGERHSGQFARQFPLFSFFVFFFGKAEEALLRADWKRRCKPAAGGNDSQTLNGFKSWWDRSQ